MDRRTTIVATLGPASDSINIIEKLMNAGVNVFRLNFSHGEHDSHEKVIRNVRKIEKKTGVPVAIMMDLQGPKMRVGKMPDGGVELVPGKKLSIVTKSILGSADVISTTYKNLPDDVKKGDRILLNDGYLELKVTGKGPGRVDCIVKSGGLLTSHKGINLPGVDVSAPSLTRKDLSDLKFGLSKGVDYVAISFVRSSEDVVKLKKLIKKAGSQACVVSKIERPEAVEDINGILEASDIVMVARGDLGVEMEPELVPEIQKSIIEQANLMGKGVITATQMLESMIVNSRPTRAEASDVANAVYDGSGAVMLSGETAVGAHPVEVVKMMSRIAKQAEERAMRQPMMEPSARLRNESGFSGTVAYSAARAAREVDAAAIIAFTESGTTARLVSKYRPLCRIFGATMRREIACRMSMYWGVTPIVFGKSTSLETLVGDVDDRMLQLGYLNEGDVVVITMGVPVGRSGTTNMMKVHRIGEKD